MLKWLSRNYKTSTLSPRLILAKTSSSLKIEAHFNSFVSSWRDMFSFWYCFESVFEASNLFNKNNNLPELKFSCRRNSTFLSGNPLPQHLLNLCKSLWQVTKSLSADVSEEYVVWVCSREYSKPLALYRPCPAIDQCHKHAGTPELRLSMVWQAGFKTPIVTGFAN